MRKTQPPRLATWLLRHFSSAPRNEPVLGDLEERYRRGRSRIWYWRQAIVAIITDVGREIWTNKAFTAIALVLAPAVRLFLWQLWEHIPHRDLPAGNRVAALIVYGAILSCCGRLVSRTASSHFKAMVLVYLVSESVLVPLTEFYLGAYHVPVGLHIAAIPIWQSFASLLDFIGYSSSIAAFLLTLFFVSLCILFGGGLLSAPPRNAPPAEGMRAQR